MTNLDTDKDIIYHVAAKDGYIQYREDKHSIVICTALLLQNIYLDVYLTSSNQFYKHAVSGDFTYIFIIVRTFSARTVCFLSACKHITNTEHSNVTFSDHMSYVTHTCERDHITICVLTVIN